MVRDLSEFHKDHAFRYGISKEGELVIMRTLYDPAVVLGVITAIWRSINARSMHAYLLYLSAPGGSHSTVEWWMGGKPPE
jgi:hypothetical protein